MALNLSIDLSDASFGDLVALVDAARSAGMDPQDEITFNGTTLSLSIDVDAFFPSFADRPAAGGGRLVDLEDPDDDLDDDPEIVDDGEFYGPRPGADSGRHSNRDRTWWDTWADQNRGGDRSGNPRSPLDFVDTSGIGDAAIRSVIDILTGRQEPPRGRR